MFNTKIILILTIILVSLFAISAVSAGDNATSDVVSVEETTVDVVKETTDEVVSIENNNQVISTNESGVGTFDELSSLIGNASKGDILDLNMDYKYDSNSNGIISINKAITINGNAHEINANKFSSIFSISSKNVVLKNIKFTNGLAEEYGGAIYALSGNFTLINCTFINNTSPYCGALDLLNENNNIINCTFINNKAYCDEGAIRITFGADNNDVINCTFINNNAKFSSGAISWHGKKGNLINCTFVNNVAGGLGTAITWFGTYGNIVNCKLINHTGESIYWTEQAFGGKLINSTFINNSKGNSIVWLGARGVIDNCLFINNSANSNGGAISISGDECILKDSTFQDNHARNGGAIYWSGIEGSLTNCVFDNNFVSSSNEGGAIYLNGNICTITDCLFINNYGYGGTAIALYSDNSIINNCFFKDNYAYGAAGAVYSNAINCMIKNSYFENNSADLLAGAIFISKNNTILENCTFVNNSANDGGAILIQGNNASLNQNSFINNNASRFGGAIYWISSDGILTNSSFNNNYAKNGGGIFWQGDNGALTDCVFIDNYAPNNGSSIYWYGNYGNLTNSIIIDNFMSNQVYWWNTENGNIENCKFINNTNGVINKGAKFSRANISLSYSNSSFDFKNPKNILVTLMDVSDDLPTYSSILFNFNKDNIVEEFIANLSDNFVSICNELSDLDAGTWNVTAIFIGDDNYAPSDVTFIVTINPLSSSLTINVNDTEVYKETKVFVTVYDKFSSKINEGSVTFFDDGTNIGEAIVTDGVATLIYTPTMAGEHIISALYHANNYGNSTGLTNLNVDKIDSNIIISDIILDYGGVGSANFSLDGAIGVNASIINMSNFIVNVTGNSIFVSDLDAGNYSLIVNTVPDANHNPVSEIIAVIVNKVDSSVIVEDIEFDYDFNGTSLVVLTGADSITASVNDVNAIVSVDDDVVTVSNLTAGSYSLSVTTVPDKNHNEITKTATITVNKIKSTLDLTNEVSFNYGETGFTNVSFTGATGVDVKVIDQSKAIINVGDEIISVSGLDGGNHVLEVTTIPDSNHVAITKQVNIMVNPISANLTATISNIEFGNNAILNIEINKEITGKLMIDNNEVVIVDGIGSYTIINPNAGNHTVSVMFEGDNNFLADTKIVAFEVTKKSVPAGQNPFTPTKTDDENQPNNPSYTITLNEDATGNLTVTIGDKTFTKELVKGTATVEVSGIPAGDYVATITYTGDKNNNPIARTVNVTVKVDPVITASNANVVYSAGSYYTIKVYGTDGELADGAKVFISVKGKTFKALTTSNGVARFKVTNVPGTYKMNITALGKSVTKTLTVKHLVTLKSVTVKRSAKKLTLQANLGKVNGKYLKNKKITFKFNGKKYTAKTDKKGVAKVTIKSSVLKKLKVGKTVAYQATYLKDTLKKTAKVKK